jgi:AcrR family transcriptional regulator
LTPPSFYAAFGSKEELFREAVQLYRSTVGAAPMQALTKPPTARASIEAMLRTAVDCFGRNEKPRGCLIVHGTMNGRRAGRKIQDHLLAIRLKRGEHIRQRIQSAVEEGDLPVGIGVDALASFFMTVLLGLSIRARDGASREALMSSVDCAMAAWDKLVAS